MIYGWQHLTTKQTRRIQQGILQGKALGGPYYMELHPTNKCNASCFFCFTDYYRTGQSLDFDVIERLLREGASGDLRFLRLSGGGEALLYPQAGQLLELMGELSLRVVDLTTNAILLGRFAEQLLEVGTDFVFVSLNECRAEDYERTMGVKAKFFGQAVEGVRNLVAAREAAPQHRRPTIALQFMVGAHNHRQVAEMYALGRELGVDQILLKSMVLVDEERQIPHAEQEKALANIRALIDEDSRLPAPALRFNLTQDNDFGLQLQEYQSRKLGPAKNVNPDFRIRKPRHDYCYMGWYGPVVAATGIVYPCCVLHEKEGKELGNIHEQNLAEIWHGEGYRRYRHQMRQVMLSRGDMVYSGRRSRCIDPMCVKPFGCYFDFQLASENFYVETAGRMEQELPRWERALAWTQDRAIRASRSLRGK